MQFKVMPFGLHSVPATFQRLLNTIFGPELEPNVFVYLNDIIIVSATITCAISKKFSADYAKLASS